MVPPGRLIYQYNLDADWPLGAETKEEEGETGTKQCGLIDVRALHIQCGLKRSSFVASAQ